MIVTIDNNTHSELKQFLYDAFDLICCCCLKKKKNRNGNLIFFIGYILNPHHQTQKKIVPQQQWMSNEEKIKQENIDVNRLIGGYIECNHEEHITGSK